MYWLHPLATVTALRFYLLTPPVRPVLLGTLYQVGHIWGTRMLDIGHYDHKAWRVGGYEKGMNCMDPGSQETKKSIGLVYTK